MKYEYDLGDIVYLKTDGEQKPRMVIGIIIRPTGHTFGLACELTESWHYAIEISQVKDIRITMNLN